MSRTLSGRRTRALLVAAAAGLAVLAGRAAYPHPALLLRTLRNARRPDIDADAVRDLAAQAPDDPDRIAALVRERLVPFAYDWDVYNVPYYFPTLPEVLRHGRGDCKSQVLVLAGLLAAKGVDFRLLVSFDHIWADYAGKRPAPMEDPAVAVAEYRAGRWHARRPSRLAARAHLRISSEVYWSAAPRARRSLLLVAGLLALAVVAGVGLRWRR